MTERSFICKPDGAFPGLKAYVVQFKVAETAKFKRWIEERCEREGIKCRFTSREEDERWAESMLERGRFPKDQWTVDELLRGRGWQDGEVLWVHIEKSRTLEYSVILKDGDYVAWIPEARQWSAFDGETFTNLHGSLHLPYSSDWIAL